MTRKFTQITLAAAIATASLASIGSVVLSTSAEAGFRTNKVMAVQGNGIFNRRTAGMLNPQPLPPGPPPCKCDIGSIGHRINAPNAR